MVADVIDEARAIIAGGKGDALAATEKVWKVMDRVELMAAETRVLPVLECYNEISQQVMEDFLLGLRGEPATTNTLVNNLALAMGQKMDPGDKDLVKTTGFEAEDEEILMSLEMARVRDGANLVGDIFRMREEIANCVVGRDQLIAKSRAKLNQIVSIKYSGEGPGKGGRYIVIGETFEVRTEPADQSGTKISEWRAK